MGTMASRAWQAVRVETGAAARVPLLGVVAAGRPLHAFPVEGALELPAGLWGGRRVFALRVSGTSMVDEGIRDGDYLIVEPRESADVGQTIVAEVDGGVTVKRLFRERDGRVRLQPANAEMLPLVLAAERVRVVGIVVGVFRRQGFRQAAAPRTRPARRAVDGRTLDLTLRVIDQSLGEAERRAASRQGRAALRLRELAQSLRGLRDCYLATRVPRLRAALLREAARLVRRLRRFDAERSSRLLASP
jgi:SOS regulatory protein LexA